MIYIAFRYWLPVFAHMALIYYLSSRSSFPVEVPPWAFYADKVVHAVIFGMLGLLFLRAWLQGKWQKINLRVSCITIAFVLFYGISDEVHQMFVPNRQPSIGDIVADVSGGILVVCIISYFVKQTVKYETRQINCFLPMYLPGVDQ